jgi:hypothetical protein
MGASVRLRVRANGDRTLQGYVFTDRQHARAWLSQSWVRPEDYALDTVEVGALCRCIRCDGSGFTQAMKTTGKMTIEEFLGEKINAR